MCEPLQLVELDEASRAFHRVNCAEHIVERLLVVGGCLECKESMLPFLEHFARLFTKGFQVLGFDFHSTSPRLFFFTSNLQTSESTD